MTCNGYVQERVGIDYEGLDEFIKTSVFVTVDDWKTRRVCIVAVIEKEKITRNIAMISERDFFILSELSREILAQKSTFAKMWSDDKKMTNRELDGVWLTLDAQRCFYFCSNCGKIHIGRPKICPRCGARME